MYIYMYIHKSIIGCQDRPFFSSIIQARKMLYKDGNSAKREASEASSTHTHFFSLDIMTPNFKNTLKQYSSWNLPFVVLVLISVLVLVQVSVLILILVIVFVSISILLELMLVLLLVSVSGNQIEVFWEIRHNIRK